jgi:hypothetical protein
MMMGAPVSTAWHTQSPIRLVVLLHGHGGRPAAYGKRRLWKKSASGHLLALRM